MDRKYRVRHTECKGGAPADALAEQKAAQYMIVVYRIEDTADGLIRSVCHAKFGPETWEKASQMLREAKKLKKADTNLIVNLIRF